MGGKTIVRINILCNEITGGWTPLDKRLGGSEESIVCWAEELAKRGHTVIVYHNERTDGWDDFTYRSENEGSRGDGTYNGVWYTPREAYTNEGAYEPGGDTICINIKSSEVAPKEPTLYLTNETNASDLDLSKYLGVIWPSQWAVDNIPVNNTTFILPHGYDPKEIYPGKKVPKQCLYASSPDRGLDTLLRAWSSVMRAHPDATLIVTYGAQEYDIPGITFVNATEEEMNKLYRESDYWLYPCNGGELYGISGIKAQTAGCWPVYFPTMALVETVQYGTKSTPETFIEDVIEALKRENPGNPGVKYPNWQDSTDKLLQIIKKVIK